jgi:hypothetical protein
VCAATAALQHRVLINLELHFLQMLLIDVCTLLLFQVI